MAATPETGFLILADLSGYTSYLSRGELEHAPAIAGDLLETIVGRLDPAGGRSFLRIMWRYAGAGTPEAAAVERLRVERASAMGRLERLLGGRRVAVLPA